MKKNRGGALAAFVIATTLIMLVIPSVSAQGPGFDSALQTVTYATVQVQQTKSARDAAQADQKLTATALENQKNALSVTQTRAAISQTETAQSQRATQTVQAKATETARANASATAIAQASETARASVSETAIAHASETKNARETATVGAQATSTRLVEIAEEEKRNADTTRIIAIIAAIAIGIALVIGVLRLEVVLRKPVSKAPNTETASSADTITREPETVTLSSEEPTDLPEKLDYPMPKTVIVRDDSLVQSITDIIESQDKNDSTHSE
jgi:hypothetical protein